MGYNVEKETQAIDRLYLELSQFTGATTKREMQLSKIVDRYGIALMMIRQGCGDPAGAARQALDECAGTLADATKKDPT